LTKKDGTTVKFVAIVLAD
jgi:hypothetical protein